MFSPMFYNNKEDILLTSISFISLSKYGKINELKNIFMFFTHLNLLEIFIAYYAE